MRLDDATENFRPGQRLDRLRSDGRDDGRLDRARLRTNFVHLAMSVADKRQAPQRTCEEKQSVPFSR